MVILIEYFDWYDFFNQVSIWAPNKKEQKIKKVNQDTQGFIKLVILIWHCQIDHIFLKKCLVYPFLSHKKIIVN